MGAHAIDEDTTLAVKVSFTLKVKPGVWAGVDGDDMTTKEVADEVRKHAETIIRQVGVQEGWL